MLTRDKKIVDQPFVSPRSANDVVDQPAGHLDQPQ